MSVLRPRTSHTEVCAWRFGMDAKCDCGFECSTLLNLTPRVHTYRLHTDRHHRTRRPYLVIDEMGTSVGMFQNRDAAIRWMTAEQAAGRATVDLHSLRVSA